MERVTGSNLILSLIQSLDAIVKQSPDDEGFDDRLDRLCELSQALCDVHKNYANELDIALEFSDLIVSFGEQK